MRIPERSGRIRTMTGKFQFRKFVVGIGKTAEIKYDVYSKKFGKLGTIKKVRGGYLVQGWNQEPFRTQKEAAEEMFTARWMSNF